MRGRREKVGAGLRPPTEPEGYRRFSKKGTRGSGSQGGSGIEALICLKERVARSLREGRASWRFTEGVGGEKGSRSGEAYKPVFLVQKKKDVCLIGEIKILRRISKEQRRKKRETEESEPESDPG